MHRPILISKGRVLDPERELHAPPVLDILVEAGHIREVGQAATARAATLGAEIVDADDFDGSGKRRAEAVSDERAHSNAPQATPSANPKAISTIGGKPEADADSAPDAKPSRRATSRCAATSAAVGAGSESRRARRGWP